jgi:hypothetical protein
VYKGLALGTSDAGPVLYAANFGSSAIDVFGGDFARQTLAGAFTTRRFPQASHPSTSTVYRGGKVYVALLSRRRKGRRRTPERNGIIDVFDGTAG